MHLLCHSQPGLTLKFFLSSAGCRGYTGNAGKNIMNVLYDTFESGTNLDWQSREGAAPKPSNESVNVGGHSLWIEKNSSRKELGSLLTKGKAYLLEFWAKGEGSMSLTPTLGEFKKGNWNPVTYKDASKKDIPKYKNFVEANSPLSLDNQWRFYSVGPVLSIGNR